MNLPAILCELNRLHCAALEDATLAFDEPFHSLPSYDEDRDGDPMDPDTVPYHDDPHS
jgi:hypothetical protein